MTLNPNIRGDAEKLLRLRFAERWSNLNDSDRLFWFEQAMRACNLDPDKQHPQGLVDLIDGFAWTMFAEVCDQNEAARIRRIGAFTPAPAAAGVGTEGGA